MFSELDNYIQRLEDLHRQVIGLLKTVPAEALNWRPLENGEDHITNSLAALAAHVAGSEHYWIGEVVGGAPATRDRAAEFAAKVEDPEVLIHSIEQTAEETRQVFSRLKKGNLDEVRAVNGKTIPVRWAIIHIIDHTALHLGHMQLTYQLWTGGKSAFSPHWFERLPETLNGSTKK